MRPAGYAPGVTAGATVIVAFVPVEATPYGEPVRAHTRHLILDALIGAGYRAREVAVRAPGDLEAVAAADPGALILNLCYGLKPVDGSAPLDQPALASLMAGLGLRLVGSGPAAQQRCQDKPAAAQLATEIGVRSPAVLTLSEALAHHGPLVVKPRSGAAHRGLRLITDPAKLASNPPGDDAMIQEYLEGPEYTVGILAHPGSPDGNGDDGSTRAGNGHGSGQPGSRSQQLEALPVVRIRYRRTVDPAPAVYDWGSTTFAPDAPGRFGLAELSLRLFRHLGLTDYGRFDYRVTAEHGPVLLDANTLPNLAPRQLLATSARWRGLQYPDFITRLIATAHSRSAPTR